MEHIDRIIPKGKWEFDEEVTKVFENMLERSIPQYEMMRDLCFGMSKGFVKEETDVLDLGCSKGDSLARLIDYCGDRNKYVGVEVSKPMLKAVRKRFEHLINKGTVQIIDMDLRKDFPIVKASLINSVLTLQFIPIEYRQRLIQNIYNSLIPNGAFVFVEKILGNNADLNDLFVSVYYELKKDNSYSEEEIERKKISLEGVLVPATAKWNEELLRMAGFKAIDCFWRCLNFSGWIAIK